MIAAYERVVSNKGAAGVDKMGVEALLGHLQCHWVTIKQELVAGTYIPQAVRKVEIPKPGGDKRMLGIPTVTDRLIQQAIAQEQTSSRPHPCQRYYLFGGNPFTQGQQRKE